MPEEQHSNVSYDEDNVEIEDDDKHDDETGPDSEDMMTKLSILLKPRDLNTSKDPHNFWQSEAMPRGRTLLHNAVREDAE